MAKAKNVFSYADVREVFDRALAAEKGIRIKQASAGAAVSFRQRLYSFRKRDREESRKIYPPEHPHHNASAYDELVAVIEPEFPDFVYIYKATARLEIEEL